jgi:outer membrane protein assembly factor BamC
VLFRSVQNNEPGLLSKLAFWRASSPDPQTKYRVHVKEDGGRTAVQVLSAEGGVDQSDTGKKILDLLFEQLK